MATANARAKRQRGEIEALPSGSLRVKVYAGVDPVTKRRHYLHETIPAGPTAQREAEKVRTRLLAQVDERRNPRTRATVAQLLDRWLEMLDVEASTRQGYPQARQACPAAARQGSGGPAGLGDAGVVLCDAAQMP